MKKNKNKKDNFFLPSPPWQSPDLSSGNGEEGVRQTRDGYTTLSRWDDNYDMDREATDCFPAATFPVDECHQKELFEIYEKYVSAWNETENDK